MVSGAQQLEYPSGGTLTNGNALVQTRFRLVGLFSIGAALAARSRGFFSAGYVLIGAAWAARSPGSVSAGKKRGFLPATLVRGACGALGARSASDGETSLGVRSRLGGETLDRMVGLPRNLLQVGA